MVNIDRTLHDIVHTQAETDLPVVQVAHTAINVRVEICMSFREKKIITFVSFEDSSTFTYHALKNPHNI